MFVPSWDKRSLLSGRCNRGKQVFPGQKGATTRGLWPCQRTMYRVGKIRDQSCARASWPRVLDSSVHNGSSKARRSTSASPMRSQIWQWGSELLVQCCCCCKKQPLTAGHGRSVFTTSSPRSSAGGGRVLGRPCAVSDADCWGHKSHVRVFEQATEATGNYWRTMEAVYSARGCTTPTESSTRWKREQEHCLHWS